MEYSIVINNPTDPVSEGWQSFGRPEDRVFRLNDNIVGCQMTDYFIGQCDFKKFYNPLKPKVKELNDKIVSNNKRIEKFSDDAAVKKWEAQNFDVEENIVSREELRRSYSDIRKKMSDDNAVAIAELQGVLNAVAGEARASVSLVQVEASIINEWEPLFTKYGLPDYLQNRILSTIRLSATKCIDGVVGGISSLGIVFAVPKDPNVLPVVETDVAAINQRLNMQSWKNSRAGM